MKTRISHQLLWHYVRQININNCQNNNDNNKTDHCFVCVFQPRIITSIIFFFFYLWYEFNLHLFLTLYMLMLYSDDNIQSFINSWWCWITSVRDTREFNTIIKIASWIEKNKKKFNKKTNIRRSEQYNNHSSVVQGR